MYMQETDANYDMPVIANLVEKHPSNANIHLKDLRSSCVVVHLRVGDVIEKHPASPKQFVDAQQQYGNGIEYVRPLSYFEENFTSSTYNDGTDVVIVAGGCGAKTMPKSLEYISLIEDWFRSQPQVSSVSVRYNQNPDDDFVFMCKAKSFIPSGGGYSRLVIKTRKYIASCKV